MSIGYQAQQMFTFVENRKEEKKKGTLQKEGKTCQQCSFVTLKRAYLRGHVALSHGQDSNPTKIINCNCDLKSYYSQQIRKHKSNEHSDNDWKIERITCGDCIFNKGDHQCQENYIEEKIYNCNQCDYTTYQ